MFFKVNDPNDTHHKTPKLALQTSNALTSFLTTKQVQIITQLVLLPSPQPF